MTSLTQKKLNLLSKDFLFLLHGYNPRGSWLVPIFVSSYEKYILSSISTARFMISYRYPVIRFQDNQGRISKSLITNHRTLDNSREL